MPDAHAASSEPAKSKGKTAPVPAVSPDALPAGVEAILLSSDRPMSLQRLAASLGLDADSAAPTNIRAAIDALNESYDLTGRSFRIEQVAGGFRMMARGEYGPIIAAHRGAKEHQTLSRAAVETLAIIAYRQPITRADLEAIRGVACGEVLRSLLEKKLIDIVGRAEELGRPMLYGTTRRFLESFGLASIKDLPSHQDFAPPPSPSEPVRRDDHSNEQNHAEAE